MSTAAVSFYVISAVILISALLSVTSRKIFRSAVWLLSSLTGIAALYFWMDLQFLAAVQIVVYIGGIVVLIIFSIFLTAHTGADLPGALNLRKVISAFVALAGFGIVTYVLAGSPMTLSAGIINSDVASIGRRMLGTGENGFVLPFEVVSILLLAAMVGCIAIAIKKKPEEI
jgi:NADH-quinone oxidoreductase subunit J